ncbi:MAG: hypothetical protein E7065_03650 [Lentimicrobiaceae bacterium]|nr:hypothetical protein [Lentimicrobiaceae bacterium]
MDYIYVRQRTTDNGQQILSVNDVKELLKDWIKLYPNSFAPDVELRIYQHEDDIIIRLHEDMSSLAVALLVLYFDNRQQTTDNGQQSLTTAYVTIDDTEVLLKQNVGKRAMIVGSQQTTEQSSSTSVRFVLDDNYCLDYDFEKRAKPVKDADIAFNEEEINLPENYETVKVGDVIKNTVDKVLEEEGLTHRKMLIYLLCGVIGLSIGFIIVYFMGR